MEAARPLQDECASAGPTGKRRKWLIAEALPKSCGKSLILEVPSLLWLLFFGLKMHLTPAVSSRQLWVL